MIETVYSNENGEANRTNRVQSAFKVPKNIRQVGKSNATKKIYVEDYVMTFIKQLTGEDYSKCKVAVLVGQNVRMDNCRSIFISGALEVEELDAAKDIIFSNDVWTSIYENIKKHFVDAEIVGWFLGGPGYLMEDKDRIIKAHIDNFAGQDKTLLTFDNMEKEEAFLFYENGRLCKQEGYYIYYEKNEEMQNYMIEHKNDVQSVEADYDDSVSRNIRAIIQNKKPVTEESKSVTRLMYAAGTLLAVIILVVGAAMLNNYDQMKTMQTALDSLSNNLAKVESVFSKDSYDVTSELNKTPETDDISQTENSLNVEIVPGEVTPIEEEREDTSGEELAENDENNRKKDEKPAEIKEEKVVVKEESKPTKKEEVKYYTVLSGDSLAGICFKLYNSANNMSKIKELNNIQDEDLIYVGQKLIVP